jgi:F0F1-type ATP synthase membrane subunit c/vacuolar-type H+-ATPase subunit K
METEAAKLIAAGLAVAPLLGAAVGLGVLFSGIVNSMARNPSMAGELRAIAFLYFALVEATGLLVWLLHF